VFIAKFKGRGVDEGDSRRFERKKGRSVNSKGV
jgi:hypothetical protein